MAAILAVGLVRDYDRGFGQLIRLQLLEEFCSVKIVGEKFPIVDWPPAGGGCPNVSGAFPLWAPGDETALESRSAHDPVYGWGGAWDGWDRGRSSERVVANQRSAWADSGEIGHERG